MRIGAYEVEGHLGAGGMSQAWLARGDRGLVVLKRQLNPADDQRLRDEAEIGMRLKHPCIVETLEVFEDAGRPVLVLEYVAGTSLVALRKRGPLAPAAVCRVGADVALGLAGLHGAKDSSGQPLRILHRDVSPSNIIVSEDGRARLIDLGIARFTGATADRTRTGDVRGTLRYLAPELFDGAEHSAKTDLWALGVCLFESVLGRQAVQGPEAAILAAIVRGKLLELRAGEKIPKAVERVIAVLCAPVALRLPTAQEAAQALVEAERAFGDGRAAASSAVYDAAQNVPAPIELTSASSDNPFARFAAPTYIGTDDDDPFALVSGSVPLLSAPVTPGSAVIHAPAPVTVLTSSSSSLTPGSDDAAGWDPPPSSRADGLEPVPTAPTMEMPGLEAPPQSVVTRIEVPHARGVTEPIPLAAGPATVVQPSDVDVDELRKSAVGGAWGVVVVLVVVVVAIVAVLTLGRHAPVGPALDGGAAPVAGDAGDGTARADAGVSASVDAGAPRPRNDAGAQ